MKGAVYEYQRYNISLKSLPLPMSQRYSMKDKDVKPVKKKIGQIQQQGKDMFTIIEKYEVPREFHSALWAAYEAGAEMGFWKAVEASPPKTLLEEAQKGDIDDTL